MEDTKNERIKGMKILYNETIGKAKISISQDRESWVVGMVEDGNRRERTFNPSPYPEYDPYSRAIACYDDTITAARRIYNVLPSTIGAPDFTKAVTQEDPAGEFCTMPAGVGYWVIDNFPIGGKFARFGQDSRVQIIQKFPRPIQGCTHEGKTQDGHKIVFDLSQRKDK